MKNLLLLAIILLMIFKINIVRADIDLGNGGDTCENRIKIIRDDIEKWILNGGSKRLKLPENTSFETYNLKMLEAIDISKITCTDDKISIYSSEKTCRNYEDKKGVKWIQCNFDRFNKTNEDEQYWLIHHEYAGISEFETNLYQESDYSISNQITAFLEYKKVKKLTIHPTKKQSSSLKDVSISLEHMGVEKTISPDGVIYLIKRPYFLLNYHSEVSNGLKYISVLNDTASKTGNKLCSLLGMGKFDSYSGKTEDRKHAFEYRNGLFFPTRYNAWSQNRATVIDFLYCFEENH